VNGAPQAAFARRHARALAWIGPAAAAAFVALLHGSSGGDTGLFVAAGRTLLSTHWSHAFASSEIQAGPLQLALFGSIGRSGAALAVVLAVATALLLLAAAAAAGSRSPALVSALGLTAVGVGFTAVGYEYGHPADAALPLIWTLALVDARRGRVVRAGVLVGLSAGLETWGILGVAALALAPRWRDAARGAAVAAAAVTVLFVPFVLAGHFSMGTYEWNVNDGTFLSLLVPAGAPFGWSLRLLQGAFAVGAGVAAARLLRRSPHAPWVVPLAVVAVRLLLDPFHLPYYRAALWGPLLVGAALVASRVFVRRGEREAFA
jgi:hypothetical protein